MNAVSFEPSMSAKSVGKSPDKTLLSNDNPLKKIEYRKSKEVNRNGWIAKRCKIVINDSFLSPCSLEGSFRQGRPTIADGSALVMAIVE